MYLLHRHRRQVVPVLCRRERGSRVLTRRSVRGLRAADAAAIVARLEHLQRCTKSRIVSLRFGTARRDRECSLNDGQVPNRNAVRVAFSTWYHRVEGNRRASRNGPVSDRPPETLQSRFATFFAAGGAHAEDTRAASPWLEATVVVGARRRHVWQLTVYAQPRTRAQLEGAAVERMRQDAAEHGAEAVEVVSEVPMHAATLTLAGLDVVRSPAPFERLWASVLPASACVLRAVDLRACGLGRAEMARLGAALRTNTSLLTLDLRNNTRVDDEALRSLAAGWSACVRVRDLRCDAFDTTHRTTVSLLSPSEPPSSAADVLDLRAQMAAARCASWVTPRARGVTLRARWVTPRARGVTLRARWVTLRAQLGDA